MRVCFIKKKELLFYSSICIVLAALIFSGTGDDIAVSGVAGSIPIYSVDTQEKKIAITFDAAWEDADTDSLLQTLSTYQAKATVFATGDFIDRCTESIRKFHDAGHTIANHSDAHPHPNQLAADALQKDTQLCNDKIKAITGQDNKLYRAPYGEYNQNVVDTIHDMGYFFIQWDVDSLDYKDLSKDEIVKRVCTKVKPGSIILFHNGTKNTAQALPEILEKLSAEGYSFVSVDELIYQDNYYVDHTGKQILENNEQRTQ